jgi:hypothetical protein
MHMKHLKATYSKWTENPVTQHNIPEDLNLQQYCHVNIESHVSDTIKKKSQEMKVWKDFQQKEIMYKE